MMRALKEKTMLRRYMPSWLKKDRTEFVLEIVSALGLAFVTLRWLQLVNLSVPPPSLW
jgi:hypothetical protein